MRRVAIECQCRFRGSDLLIAPAWLSVHIFFFNKTSSAERKTSYWYANKSWNNSESSCDTDVQKFCLPLGDCPDQWVSFPFLKGRVFSHITSITDFFYTRMPTNRTININKYLIKLCYKHLRTLVHVVVPVEQKFHGPRQERNQDLRTLPADGIYEKTALV